MTDLFTKPDEEDAPPPPDDALEPEDVPTGGNGAGDTTEVGFRPTGRPGLPECRFPNGLPRRSAAGKGGPAGEQNALAPFIVRAVGDLFEKNYGFRDSPATTLIVRRL